MQYDLFSDEELSQDTIFTGRVVCLLGTFRQSAKHIQMLLTEMGAVYKPSTKVSRNVHFVLVGQGAPQEQTEYLQTLAFHGFNPRVIHQKELDEILEGHTSQYSVPLEIRKDLHLTYQHYLQCRLLLKPSFNSLYTKELYLPSSSDDLYQKLGNKGIYANSYMDDATDIIVLSDASLQRLEAGESDDAIRYIEQTYNKSKSQNFRYVLTSESELYSWLDSIE